MKPELQVALDFLNLDRAIKVAEESVAGGVDRIEVGTPLIKSEGLDAVREIKKRFPKHKIVADMKVMDTGRYEIESAVKAGADIVVLLGVADDSTIKDAVQAARNYGCELMVDLMNVEDMEKRAREVEAMGVDYICVHVGIDQQMRGMDPISELKKISRSVRIPLAIAGGINSETAPIAVESGASIIIVGGAISKAENAKKATEIIKKAIEKGKPIKTELYKKYADPLKILGKVSTANISDAMHRSGHMEGIRAVSGTGERVAGRAVTVRTCPGDWAKTVEAIDVAEKGDIIVIDSGGTGKAVWGELASWSCKRKGVSAVVIDGTTRDLEDIRKIGFPVFAREVKPTAGEPKGFGEINVPIKCGNIPVKPGDYIVGDLDGVVVVPKEKAVEVANRALDVFEKENRIRKEIRKGSTLSRVLKIKKWERQG
ncbi:MAG: 3-hexulose-6-phosphate synthase [Candidatus Altiarchaeales archaeon ex4484_43]|nr:MAG: 3-hexulose-6-phosphate synthase [Candidatus Altiarchaeales archaeon ex4484_43]